MHRDIKPANILLNEKWQIQLADFGTAKKQYSSTYSSNSFHSSVSFVSGMSNLSALSGLSKSPMRKPESSQGSDMNRIEDDDDVLVGTPLYMSPEMLISRSYSYASDLWAVGIMLYQMFFKTTPFRGKTQDQTFDLIKACKLAFPAIEAPPAALDLINKLVVLNPSDRIGFSNMIDLLKHEFFSDIDFSKVETQLPPCDLELTDNQKILLRHLPDISPKTSPLLPRSITP